MAPDHHGPGPFFQAIQRPLIRDINSKSPLQKFRIVLCIFWLAVWIHHTSVQKQTQILSFFHSGKAIGNPIPKDANLPVHHAIQGPSFCPGQFLQSCNSPGSNLHSRHKVKNAGMPFSGPDFMLLDFSRHPNANNLHREPL